MAVEDVKGAEKEESSFEPKPFGRYVLLDKLAVGGMAEIYKAKTYGVDGFEKLLAIKRILPHCAADKEFISMLIDEAKLTVLLSHANIVQVFDLGKVGDDYFISMEFINGTNLREVMTRLAQKGEKLPEEIAVYIMSECCKGLDYAHRKTDYQGIPLNIVHRDISPQNILVSFEGEIKIVDFGIAKAAMNVSHTMAGILKGKIAYMSPEQALGKPIDHRTDIFSAGVVLYEMLTGEKLFTGETQFEVLNKIRTTRLNTTMLPEQLPASVKAILCKALAYNPKDRYQSVGDFQLDLTKFLYSSFIDFSPRHLASLLQKMFSKEIARKAAIPQLDDKTRSVLIKQAEQEDIMVHGSSQPRAAVTQKTAVSGIYSLPGVKKAGRMAIGLGILAAAAGLGYFGYQFFKPEAKREVVVQKTTPVQKERTPPPAAPEAVDIGSFRVATNPSGAQIFLNDADTGLTTPSTLQKLPLGREYEIRLVKKQYKEFKKKFALMTTEPILIDEPLEALPLGVIDISSSPAGAKIFLDGQNTGKATPSKIENLHVPKDYQIKLALEGHADWFGGVQVKDLEPVKLIATLTNLPKIEQPSAPPPSTAEKPKAARYGKLDIRSNPSQAKILLDGKDTGEVTPSTFDQLEAGRKLNVTLQKEGYEAWSRRGLTIKGNETANVSASLNPEIKEEAKPEPHTPTTAAIGGKPASLKLDSEPSGADVYVNAEFKGTTPVTVTSIPAGAVKLLISKQGYLRYSSNITLDAGELKSLGTIQLQGLFGEISINSTPPRANIYFDGDMIPPKTPVTINKVPRDRKHTIRIQLDGYEPWETTVDLSSEGNKKYNAVLEKK
ncbi:MAG: serine/threonine protein kinase [Deltaproteobacteria bacterium]|nr:serine/threonine protein kinase [Deltaproteobacteria bacterium]